jgi:arylsulfatase A-like enzyme
VYGLAPWFRSSESLRDIRTLPEYFRLQGYTTFTVGKIHHSGYPLPADRAREFSVFASPMPGAVQPRRPFTTTPAAHPLMDWGPFPDEDSQHPDAKVADWAIQQLQAPKEPFFLCVGFQLPHVPCYAPQKWFDLYPDDDSILPAIRLDDRADTPEFSWYLHWKLPEPRLSWLQSSGQWRPLVRAYLASISFVDSQVGRVLDALEREGLQDNTIVVLWSDHGWHLGEKGISGKNSLWERSTHVPLIFAGPGISQGTQSAAPVELLDIYPTLADCCRLPLPEHLEGHSLLRQLHDPHAPREWPAITTHNQGNHAVRSDRWRYIRYADDSEELYDMQEDPHEWVNLANDPNMNSVLAEHRRWLPKIDVAPVSGSAHRILSYDKAKNEAVWEGKVIAAVQKEE